jgi:hypothetical protein
MKKWTSAIAVLVTIPSVPAADPAPSHRFQGGLTAGGGALCFQGGAWCVTVPGAQT